MDDAAMSGTKVSSVRSFASRARLYFAFTRPFTLLPPTFGVVSGALCAFGSAHNPDPERRFSPSVILMIALGSLTAALLNAASNVINQYHDLEIDRRNKPLRPLASGAISPATGRRFAALLYVLALAPTWLVVIYPRVSFLEKATAPVPEHQCFFIYLAGLVFTLVYSDPAWGRTKRFGIWANLTIAVPRGCLLKVAGWSMVGSVFHLEAWYIGAIPSGCGKGGALHRAVLRPAVAAHPARGLPARPVWPGPDPDRWPSAPVHPGRGPVRLGRLDGPPDPARSRGPGEVREPPLLDPHVPDDDVRPGRVCRGLPCLGIRLAPAPSFASCSPRSSPRPEPRQRSPRLAGRPAPRPPGRPTRSSFCRSTGCAGTTRRRRKPRPCRAWRP
ncbi:MAG: UbiA family prenyltransferase, partial [Candidatus Rokubacteria bacterium]|nr:UbiA family prenyltransferase [Candidatus Rokubacteria bacterium]